MIVLGPCFEEVAHIAARRAVMYNKQPWLQSFIFIYLNISLRDELQDLPSGLDSWLVFLEPAEIL